MESIPRMRKIKEAYKEIKTADPATELTATGFRRLVISGKIPSVKVGNIYLVNMDIVKRFLGGETT